MSTKSTQAENTAAQPPSEAKVTPFMSGAKAPQVTVGNQMTDEQLDGVVGGLNITLINRTQSDVLDSVVVFQKPPSGADHLTVAIAPPPTSEQVLADISTQFGNEFAASVGKTGAVPALEHAVQSAVAKFTAHGFDAASAKALA